MGIFCIRYGGNYCLSVLATGGALPRTLPRGMIPLGTLN